MFGRGRRAAERSAAIHTASVTTPRTLWSDGFGTLATRSIQIIAVAVLAAGLVIAYQSLSVVVVPVLLALILACAFEPIMRWLRARINATLATVIVLLGIVVVLGGIVWAMVAAVRSQWEDLYDSATEGFQQVLAWVNTLPFAPSQDQLDEWFASITDFVTSSQFGNALGSGAVAGVGAVATFVTGLVLLVVVLFFFLKDGPQLWAFLSRPFEGEWYARVQRAGVKTVETFGAYIRGTAAVAAVDAIGIGAGLFILGVPLALPLTVLVFLLAFIPIVGATVAGVLAALVALVANGPVAAVIAVAIVIVVNQLEGNLLQPVLMGRALKLHSLVILIALTIGTVLGGILGAILAAPLAAVVWGIVQVWDGPNTPARWARKKERPAV
ncbi:AI-2E family transporter [Microbacterium betulae]|uniref:AI-2E family transporter n=1 Tax=Microbacterium betulae TaxID=2981139 RepID=A0AA97I4E2_9MICO|nr:AI-2E family transporter [Microbacterium sp. AB]WOF22516.1 AI-2E family transporter [Microbacterium sp. AB]